MKCWLVKHHNHMGWFAIAYGTLGGRSLPSAFTCRGPRPCSLGQMVHCDIRRAVAIAIKEFNPGVFNVQVLGFILFSPF